MKKDRRTEMSREIGVPVEAVWKALTEAEELQRWFPLEAVVSPEDVKLTWGGGIDWNMKIEEQKENEYLRWGYDKEHHHLVGQQARRLAVEFFLEAKKGSTLLRIVHSGFGEEKSWDDLYDGVRRGWQTESLSLKHYLENHAGKDRIVALAEITSKKAEQELWDFLNADGVAIDGDQYTYTTPLGDLYKGALLYSNPPQDLCGTLQHLNNAMLRISIERFYPGADNTIWIWIGAYDVPEQTMKELQQKWQDKLQQLIN